MALTVTLNQPEKFQIGPASPYGTTNFIQVAKLVFDNSYPANGYPISASQFGMNTVLGMFPIAIPFSTSTCQYTYDSNLNTLRILCLSASNTAAFSSTLSAYFELPVGSAMPQNTSPSFLVIGV